MLVVLEGMYMWAGANQDAEHSIIAITALMPDRGDCRINVVKMEPQPK